MSEIPPQRPVPDRAADAKTWTVGTLVYTSGALTALFCWLLMGDFAWSMRERSVGPMANWYLSQLGVPNWLFGVIFSSFPALVSMIVGPIISVKSDRHRGPRGRRIPYLMLTTPIAAFGMIGIALTPIIASWLHGALSVESGFGGWMHRMLDGTAAGDWTISHMQNEMFVSVFCFGVFWAIFEFATIASFAVFGGLINDTVPKPLLGRFYGLFRAIHLIDGMIFNFWIMGHVPQHFTVILCATGLFYGIAFMWMCYRVKEGSYPPPENSAAVVGRGRVAGFWAEVVLYCRECFSKPYYVTIFVMVMVSTVVFMPVNIYAIPYAKSLNVSMDTYGKLLSLTFLISFALSFVLGWLCDLFHPLRMVMISLAGYAVVTLWGAVYATTAHSFLIAWVLHGVLSGCYFTTVASLGQRLYPHDKFAQFASAAVNLTAIATMLIVPAIGLLIDSTDGAYRITFIGACALAIIALGSAFFVHARFMKLGGPKNYVAP